LMYSLLVKSTWSQAVVPTALLRASCPSPFQGRTSCVLICSRQISRPLSHLSGLQWQVASFPRHSCLYFEGRYHTRIISCFNPIELRFRVWRKSYI
jgi:hypothetical protein